MAAELAEKVAGTSGTAQVAAPKSEDAFTVDRRKALERRQEKKKYSLGTICKRVGVA